MSDQNPPVRIPEKPRDAVSLVEEDAEEDTVDENRRALIKTQAALIGDID